MGDDVIELHQFTHSHFNEKARWALDFKGLRHVRINYLPGPHVAWIRAMTSGTQVPVLKLDGSTIAGSAAILAELERRWPEPALVPAAGEERGEALAIQARLDEELGPAIRLAFFEATLDDAPGWVADTFSAEKPAWKRSLYAAAFPILVRPLLKQAMGITPANAAPAVAKVDEILDFLAEKAAPTGYLVGASFSIADLTAAALLGPALRLEHPDMAHPEGPEPRRYRELADRWNAHPAFEWARGIYARHRPPRRGIVIA